MAKGRRWVTPAIICALVSAVSGLVMAQTPVGPTSIALGQELAGGLEAGDAELGSGGLHDDFVFEVEAAG